MRPIVRQPATAHRTWQRSDDSSQPELSCWTWPHRLHSIAAAPVPMLSSQYVEQWKASKDVWQRWPIPLATCILICRAITALSSSRCRPSTGVLSSVVATGWQQRTLSAHTAWCSRSTDSSSVTWSVDSHEFNCLPRCSNRKASPGPRRLRQSWEPDDEPALPALTRQ